MSRQIERRCLFAESTGRWVDLSVFRVKEESKKAKWNRGHPPLTPNGGKGGFLVDNPLEFAVQESGFLHASACFRGGLFDRSCLRLPILKGRMFSQKRKHGHAKKLMKISIKLKSEKREKTLSLRIDNDLVRVVKKSGKKLRENSEKLLKAGEKLKEQEKIFLQNAKTFCKTNEPPDTVEDAPCRTDETPRKKGENLHGKSENSRKESEEFHGESKNPREEGEQLFCRIDDTLRQGKEKLRAGMERLNEEVRAVRSRDPAAKTDAEVLTLYSGVHAMIAYRAAHALHQRGHEYVARFISQSAKMLTGIEIHPGAVIGRELFIDHGSGVVIGETTVVGNGCTIYQGATLGGTGKESGKRHPTLGDNVMVGAGAKVLGPVHIGNNSKIAAGAVVLTDIPENCTAVGIPARIVRKDNVRVDADLDQIHIPDPVEKEFVKIREELEELRSMLPLSKKD